MANDLTGENSAEKRIKQSRARRVWLFGGVAVMFLAMLAVLQVAGLWNIVTPEEAADTLALDALSSFVFVAFIVFAFIFLRSFLKLQRERSAGQIGSKIKTRLVRYFIAISLVPIATMAVFSYLFFNRSLEKWFNRLPENVVNDARFERIEDVSETAALLASVFEADPQLVNEENFGRLLASANLSALELVTPRGEILQSRMVQDADTFHAGQTAALNDALKMAREEIRNGATHDANCQMEFCFAFVALNNKANNQGDAPRLIVVRADPHLARIAAGAESFQYLRSRQVRLRQKGILTIALLTLLSLFASMWIALHLARGLATPIAALTEAAHEVARGNLNFRVTTTAEDELALLAASFNDMTAQLAENRRRIEANATELHEKNLALAERRAYIETVLESLSNGVISLDAEDRVTTINGAALQMLLASNKSSENDALEPHQVAMRGRAEIASVIGKRLAEILSAEDYAVFAPVIRRARRAGRASQQAELVRRNFETSNGAEDESANGARVMMPIALTATALNRVASRETQEASELSSLRERRGVVLVIEDLTELLTAQRAAAWREVARRMAHEIKNPLTPIQLSAERIARHFARLTNDEAKESAPPNSIKDNPTGSRALQLSSIRRLVAECTETIVREVAGLKAMVDEFARFARLPAPKFEPSDLNEIVRQALALYEDRLDGARLEARLADGMPSAMLDVEQMRRAIVNLIDNAREAIDNDLARHAARQDNGGSAQDNRGSKQADGAPIEPRITVATAHDPARGRLLVEITDTGHGITKQDFPRLFQPYFSTRGRGTGLGLAIVERIVAEHGGRIRAEANYPKGAKFIIELPTTKGAE